VMACASRSAYNADVHLRGALEAGATKEEVTEALMIAVGEDAEAQLSWNHQVLSKFLGNNKP
jgi:alkylhydroperoxidase/carboxymuconolactone decarboxylase family protein YurZ